MKRTVHYMGDAPGKTPKATKFADIKDQGKIPYGKTADVKIPSGMKRRTARGMGAARKGGGYWGFK
jgi:hypothetical protein|tara:strand:- start:253 stop:450 length:198 start_codon:yes stop_codon:yes gene_type:complete